jgi:DNA-directed RNA polymerase subunit RPC12/RpoP
MPRSVPWTTQKFIERALLVEKHRGKFDYSKVNYVNSQTKVIIICIVCNTEFLQVPNSHLQGYGCDKCAHIKNRADQTNKKEDMIKKAVEVHGDAFDYTDSVYTLSRNKIDIKCNECGKTFRQTPNNHISKGFGCPHCAKNAILTTEGWIEKANTVHVTGEYDYTSSIYTRSFNKIEIKCNRCEKTFWQVANLHLRGQGCPYCKPKYSKVSCEYMRYLAVSNPSIQYGEIEHKIKNHKRYRADGYIPETDEVIEFHGCIFHGCPKCYPFGVSHIGVLYAKLLENTIVKRDFVKTQGYKYSEIWGHEWENAKWCVKILQKRWRTRRI